MLHLGFLLAAFILFLLAAVGVSHPRCNLMALGLALLTLAFLFPTR
jgi:hypothetical protein